MVVPGILPVIHTWCWGGSSPLCIHPASGPTTLPMSCGYPRSVLHPDRFRCSGGVCSVTPSAFGHTHTGKMGAPLALWPTTMRPSQRPSSFFRTMPSPDGLRFATMIHLLCNDTTYRRKRKLSRGTANCYQKVIIWGSEHSGNQKFFCDKPKYMVYCLHKVAEVVAWICTIR